MDDAPPNVPPEDRSDSTDLRLDGFMSLLKGLGVRGRDPVRSERAQLPILTDDDLEDAYRGEAVAARIVDLLPAEALREGWGVRIDEMADGSDVDPANANAINDDLREYLRKLGALQKTKQGFSLGRLFGGSLAIGGFADTGSDLARLSAPRRPGTELRWLIVHDRRVATPGPLEDDPSSSDFGLPKSYEVTILNGSKRVTVHASRVIRFPGRWAPQRFATEQRSRDPLQFGWDDSVLLGTWEPLKHFAMTHETTARVARDFSRAVYRLKNLHNLIAANREDLVRKRFELIELCQSVLNAVLLDADAESFELVQRPITGLPELLDRFGNLLAAATGYPITLLLGLSPGGFGTGEDEDRRWGNVTRSYQDDVVRPALERLCTWAFEDPAGPTQGAVPKAWSITFPQTRAPSEKEKAEIRGLIADAWSKLVASEILLPNEAAEGMFGSGQGFGMDVTLDRDAREEAARVKEQQLEAETEAMLAAARAPKVAPPVGPKPPGGPATPPPKAG